MKPNTKRFGAYIEEDKYARFQAQLKLDRTNMNEWTNARVDEYLKSKQK